MIDLNPFQPIYLSPSVAGLVPAGRMRKLAEALARRPGGTSRGSASNAKRIVVASASWLIETTGSSLRNVVDSDTRFLVVADVPEPALLQLPSILGLHKPHLRLHVSRDRGVIKRLLLAHHRTEPWGGIVDAYPLGDRLVVVLGDMTIRTFPRKRLPRLSKLTRRAFEYFELDPSGSFLHWPAHDIHLGASQMLQAVDPEFLAEIEIQRYAMDKTSLALLAMRNERGLTQTEIPGLSDRHVRRLENEEGRLTVDAAEKLAAAFELDLSEFLDELSRRVTALREESEVVHA